MLWPNLGRGRGGRDIQPKDKVAQLDNCVTFSNIIKLDWKNKLIYILLYESYDKFLFF